MRLVIATTLICAALSIADSKAETEDTLQPVDTAFAKLLPSDSLPLLERCEIAFHVKAVEPSQGGRTFIEIEGTVGLRQEGKTLVTFLSARLREPHLWEETSHSGLSNAFLFTEDGYRARGESVLQEPDGSLWVLFRLDPAFEIVATGLMKQSILVGVVKRGKNAMIEIELDAAGLAVQSNAGSQPWSDTRDRFFQCAHRLLKEFP